MNSLSEAEMRAFLSRSISSLNRNKLNGLLAEVDFRRHLNALGFGSRVSRGGWIARRIGAGEFAHQTAVFFPESILPDVSYPPSRTLPPADNGLHTICSTFHQTGINAYYCAATIDTLDALGPVSWHAVQLGVPVAQDYQPFPACVSTIFSARTRKHNHLRYKTDATAVPLIAVPDEFSKESLRICFANAFMAETSDVDGILWGQRHTYPLEIKEKTAGDDKRLGAYFGLDVGPFVKLAYYAARRGNLHSLFIVREILDVESRELVNWWFITFDELAQYASWVSRAGGPSMGGGASSVVCIPKAEFKLMNATNLSEL